MSLKIIAEIAEQSDLPGSWSVAARRNGILISMAIFGGGDAKRRAVAYARENYALILPPHVRKASGAMPAEEIEVI